MAYSPHTHLLRHALIVAREQKALTSTRAKWEMTKYHIHSILEWSSTRSLLQASLLPIFTQLYIIFPYCQSWWYYIAFMAKTLLNWCSKNDVDGGVYNISRSSVMMSWCHDSCMVMVVDEVASYTFCNAQSSNFRVDQELFQLKRNLAAPSLC